MSETIVQEGSPPKDIRVVKQVFTKNLCVHVHSSSGGLGVRSEAEMSEQKALDLEKNSDGRLNTVLQSGEAQLTSTGKKICWTPGHSVFCFLPVHLPAQECMGVYKRDYTFSIK